MLSEIIAGFPNITELHLGCAAAVPLLLRRAHPCSRARSRGRHRYCKKLTQESIVTIGRGCSKLTKLDISRTGVTDLSEIGRGCSKLTELDISGTGVTDLSEIGRGCPDLESLNLAHVHCTDISEIARGCRKLKSLCV